MTPTARHPELKRFALQLRRAAETIEKDDLVALAALHGTAEELSALLSSDGPIPAEPAELLQRVRKGAEDLILGNAADPAAVLHDLRLATSMLDEALARGGDDASASRPENRRPIEGAVHDALAQLEKAIGRVVADDLPLLAKMHGWCVALKAETTNAAAQPELAGRLSRLHEELEQLIVGTTADVDASMNEVKALVSGLVADWPGPPTTCSPAPPAAAAELSDEEVAAKLAKVFDEPPTERVADAAESPALGGPKEIPNPPAAGVPSYVPEPLVLDAKELEFVGAFVEEAKEHIEAIEAAVLEVEQQPANIDKINELFRPFHTIKGMAGFLNLRDVNALAHEAETLLDQGRRGERKVTPGVIDAVFAVVDVLKAQIAAIGRYVLTPDNRPISMPPVAELIERLRLIVAGQIDPDAGQRAARSEVPTNCESAGASADPDAPAPRAPPSDAPPAGAPRSSPAVSAADQSVRIDTAKLDALVDLVGELVIAQTLISSNAVVQRDPKLARDAGQVSKIVRDVQEIAMAMRMIPVKGTFQKMVRLVRDLSRKADKQVELVISGEETELDKNVIQQIGDPLVHMVRNAVDHGIESPSARRAAGKPEGGRVWLNAFHHSGDIVVEIRDDGKGLDPAVLIAKAIEKGIIRPDEELTDEQAFQLIFAPGFSTAAVVTDISGRGVGMDVVKRNIEQLRGKIEIESRKGEGTRFLIRLPLTLAIIDGMLVRIGAERFIIPTTAIEQTLRPVPEQITTVQNRGEVLRTRKELIPVIQLGEMYRLTGRIDPTTAMVVIAQTDRGPVGVVVEELIGQQQVVIKSLGEQFQRLRGITGAAILGDGRVGLILDASGVRSAWDRWRASTIRKTPPQQPAPKPVEPALQEVGT